MIKFTTQTQTDSNHYYMMQVIKVWVSLRAQFTAKLIKLSHMEAIPTNLLKVDHLFLQICNTITSHLNLMVIITWTWILSSF